MILLPERLNDKQIELYNLLNEDRYVEYLFYGSSRAGIFDICVVCDAVYKIRG